MVAGSSKKDPGGTTNWRGSVVSGESDGAIPVVRSIICVEYATVDGGAGAGLVMRVDG